MGSLPFRVLGADCELNRGQIFYSRKEEVVERKGGISQWLDLLSHGQDEKIFSSYMVKKLQRKFQDGIKGKV